MTEESSCLTFDSVFVGSRRCNESSASSKQQKPSKLRTDLDVFLKKTPLAILEEGSKGSYQQSVTWNTGELISTTGPEFEMVLVLKDISVKAKGFSKKAAKQKAAIAYLREAVNKGRKNDFFIPGESLEEAHANINLLERIEESKKITTTPGTKDLLLKDVDRSIPTAQNIPPHLAAENWVGKLQEKAQKMKLDPPFYEDKSLDGKFLVTCSMCEQKTNGLSSTKKAAKNIAAFLMLDTLTGVSRVQSSHFDFDLTEIEENDQVSNNQKQAFAEKNKKLALEKLLSDKKRFSTYIIKFLQSSISTFGKHQIMLEVQTTRPVSPDLDELEVGAEHTQTPELIRASSAKEKERKNFPDSGSKVFAGMGLTEEEAVEQACQSALIHFNTY